MRFSMFNWFLSQYGFVRQRTSWLKMYEHYKNDSMLKTVTNYTRHEDEREKKQTKLNLFFLRIFLIFLRVFNGDISVNIP